MTVTWFLATNLTLYEEKKLEMGNFRIVPATISKMKDQVKEIIVSIAAEILQLVIGELAVAFKTVL